MSEPSILCPFDKNPCVRQKCAVWSEDTGACSFASLPGLVRSLKTRPDSVQPTPIKKESDSSGSGKYRTLLFD